MTMRYDFDVLVIGRGAGGATFGYACANAGKSVLVVERGNRYAGHGQPQSEQAMLIEKRPYDDRTVQVNGQPRRLYAGGVLGGSTALYGAALMRPSEGDFHPGRYYSERLPRALWDWPITYGALEPHYTTAERLFGVAGCAADDYGPLGKPRQGFPQEALPVKPINRRLMEANAARGLRPFRLPLAIDFRRCLQCNACPGHICPNGARRSSAQLVEESVAAGAHLQLLTGVEAEELLTDGQGQVSGVQVCNRATGQRTVYRARRYALGAGALGSPLLLLRSGLGGPLVGRHYMFHVSPVVAGVFPRRIGADATFVKQVGFADYYLGTRRFPHKLGLIQSLPVPGPLMLAKAGGGRIPQPLLQALRRRMLPLVGIVEDLPNPRNRIELGQDGRPALRHAFALYDIERGRWLSGLMRQILRRAGALLCLGKALTSEEHVAHQCGTLRFGKTAADAVTDPDCRVFGQPNLFVVDGSFFPTSLGVGPALTIIANALRVADVVTKEI
jgi:choline dehydrogenase-like flavoprotein